MAKIIAVANQKGGVGKTTTSVNIAAGLAYLNQRVLLVDFDAQGNATQGLGCCAPKYNVQHSVYDLIMNQSSFQQTVQHLKEPPLDILPATIDLAGADLQMSEYKTGRENFLKRQLEPVQDQYDFIIIDCPPSLGLLNTNALTAADTVLIPVQCEYYALEGLTQLLSTIRLVNRLFNNKLKIEGVLLTMYDSRTNLSKEVSEEVRKYFKEIVYKTNIPRTVRFAEAPSKGESIFQYDVRGEGSKAYAAVVREILTANKVRR